VSHIDWFGEDLPPDPPPKFDVVDPDAGEDIHRACPHCGRPLKWKYDTARAFTIGVARCIVHGDLDTWAIVSHSKDEAWGAGRLTAPGILCDPPVSKSEAIVEHRMQFKAVAPKRNLRGRKGTPLFGEEE
jgi:endogenous inhibitor of DNA gyrase (YacG/DUF329 family)